MCDPERVIFDISSDEEVGHTKTDGKKDDDYDWISELFDEGDAAKKDDSDDVVVLGEVINNPKQNLKFVTTTKSIDDDDDDCVVLEEDPDKPVEVENDRGDDDSDELLLVSEKGQVACRDYPHSRHLCAKFPYGSTPHERHCDQCHCYVCDTIAPCAFWRTGVSGVAHCDATDKENYWKAQRQNTRKSGKAPPLVSTLPDTSVSVPQLAANHAPSQARTIPNYYQPQNQVIRQALRPCSMTNSPGLSNYTSQRYTTIRDQFHSHVVSQQLRNASINVNPRDGPNGSHLGPQFFSNRTAFKRAGSSGLAYAYNPLNTSSVPQLSRTHSSVPCVRVPVGSNNYRAPYQANTVMLGANAVSCQPHLQRQHGLVDVSVNYAPMGSPVTSQTNAAIVGANALSALHPLTSQSSLMGFSANYAPVQPSQSIPGANFQPQLHRRPSLAGLAANYVSMEPVIPSAVSFQPHLSRQPRFVTASANGAQMEPWIPSQPQVSVCPNSASVEASAFSLPHANSSSSQPLSSKIPSILSEFESFISSENAVASPAQVGNMYDSPLAPDAQMSSPVYADRNSANDLPQQTLVAFQPEGENVNVNTAACSANAGTTLGGSTTTLSQLSNQADRGSQPELSRQHVSSLSDNQHVSHQGYLSEDGLGSGFDDFDFSWETHVSQVDSLDNVYNPKSAEAPEVSRLSHLAESTFSMENQYDEWLVSGQLEVPISTGFNVLSPEVPAINSGFHVDF